VEEATGVAGVYPGGVLWGVRWNEVGSASKIDNFGDDEVAARSLYRSLTGRYADLGRNDKPELVAARIHWQVQG